MAGGPRARAPGRICAARRSVARLARRGHECGFWAFLWLSLASGQPRTLGYTAERHGTPRYARALRASRLSFCQQENHAGRRLASPRPRMRVLCIPLAFPRLWAVMGCPERLGTPRYAAPRAGGTRPEARHTHSAVTARGRARGGRCAPACESQLRHGKFIINRVRVINHQDHNDNGVLSGYTPAVEVPVPGAPPGVGPLSRAGGS